MPRDYAASRLRVVRWTANASSSPRLGSIAGVLNPRVRGYELLRVKEVCELLQVTQTTVYKLIKAGKIPAFKIGADWRFRKDLIVRWMAEQTTALD